MCQVNFARCALLPLFVNVRRRRLFWGSHQSSVNKTAYANHCRGKETHSDCRSDNIRKKIIVKQRVQWLRRYQAEAPLSTDREQFIWEHHESVINRQKSGGVSVVFSNSQNSVTLLVTLTCRIKNESNTLGWQPTASGDTSSHQGIVPIQTDVLVSKQFPFLKNKGGDYQIISSQTTLSCPVSEK